MTKVIVYGTRTILFALEGIDQNKDYVFDIVIPRDAKIEPYEKDLLNGVMF